MGLRSGFVSSVILAPLVFLAGCGGGKGPAPVVAEKPRAESDLARTVISSEAYKSLKIQSQAPVVDVVQEHRTLTGWIVPSRDEEVTIAAPVAGYVLAAAGKTFPKPGDKVEAEQVLQLEPIVSPLEMIQVALLKRGVESELKKAKDSVAVAMSEEERLRDLVKQGLRGKQELEQAQARLSHAREDLAAAEDKLRFFSEKGKGVDLAPIAVRAPRAGTILDLHVGPGQYVAAGTPLFTVIQLEAPWVRVPVPEADLARVQQDKPIEVTLRSEADGKEPVLLQAKRLALLPEVDPIKRTATLLYALEPGGKVLLAKEQMVTVAVPFGPKKKQTVIPYSAVVFDAYGGAWVYLDRSKDKDEERVFERRRIELGASFGPNIVVTPPLKAEDRVVVEGAGVLFSREFFRPPVPKAAKIEVDDDD